MKYMVLEIKDNQVVVADTSNDKEWDSFYNRMMQADESGTVPPKYAVYDVEYELPGGDGKRFVSNVPYFYRFLTDSTKIKALPHLLHS